MSMEWKKRKESMFILAPMAEVTDVVFREFIARHAPPDLYYTEFVSCKGLLSQKGKKHLIRDLFYTQKQKPLVAQVFGGDPDDFAYVAEFLETLGFDGMDINMGCPDKKVEKQGAGAALINDPERARKILRSARKGTQTMSLSVKTRIGYNTINTREWIRHLCEEKPDFITVHGRTRKELSKVPAHWEEIQKAVSIASEYDIPVVGNGDVMSRKHGIELAQKTGVSGIMIGRGVYGNPWIFETTEKERTWKDRLKALPRLIMMFDSFWGNNKNYDILKRFFASYIQDFSGAKSLRIRMMETREAKESLRILCEYIQTFDSDFYIDPEDNKIELSPVFINSSLDSFS